MGEGDGMSGGRGFESYLYFTFEVINNSVLFYSIVILN